MASLLQEIHSATNGQVDKVCLDIPLLIRLLEYAREDAKSDADLHKVAEKLVALSSRKDCLDMADYDSAVSTRKEVKEGVPEDETGEPKNHDQMEEFLSEAIECYANEENLTNISTSTYREAGMMTRNSGLVIEFSNGSEFQVTIVQRK